MKRITFILTALILAVLFMVPNAFADEGTMQAANALYENGRYAEAIQAYQQLADQGIKDANLFYNLGNAYYQSGDLGNAILNYRRAAQIAPRESDIQSNLTLARQQRTNQLNQAPDNIVDIYLVDVANWLSLNETAVIALTLWTILCLMVFAIRKMGASRFKMTLKYGLVPVALLCMMALFTLGSRLQTSSVLPDAVIVAQVADVYSGPGTQFGSDFQLHTGAEVDLYQTRGDWAQISIPGLAARGWVPATAVTAVN